MYVNRNVYGEGARGSATTLAYAKNIALPVLVLELAARTPMRMTLAHLLVSVTCYIGGCC